MFDFGPRRFSKQEMDFVANGFKWAAIKSSDCDVNAKVWLGSLLFVFFSSPFPRFGLFISFVFKEFNEAENIM